VLLPKVDFANGGSKAIESKGKERRDGDFVLKFGVPFPVMFSIEKENDVSILFIAEWYRSIAECYRIIANSIQEYTHDINVKIEIKERGFCLKCPKEIPVLQS
jgi:hypothetical protein